MIVIVINTVIVIKMINNTVDRNDDHNKVDQLGIYQIGEEIHY